MSAKDNDFDIVLIDTAGRMQDNEVCIQILLLAHDVPFTTADVQPLMRALAKVS